VSKQTKNRGLGKALFSSPLLVALGAAVVVVFVLAGAGYVRRGGFWSPSVEARVFSYGRGERAGGEGRNGERTFAFQGEVYSDAERLREAAALGVGGMLLAAQRNLDRAPIATVEGLLGAMESSGLLPPAMSVDERGSTVNSQYGVYYVRYRSQPLGVEIVSVGKGNLAGPPLLVRLPDSEFSQNALTYFVAPTPGEVTVPVAFAETAQVIASGWQPVMFKSKSVSADEAEKGRQWLVESRGK
jgi:hypothetical protein